jgi:hypothetical protein
MTTSEIAGKLAAYCSKCEWESAQNELYAEDAISIEPYAMDGYEKETKGLQAIKEKGRKFDSSVEEFHSVEVSEPLVVENSITFKLTMDLTVKGKGRMKSSELCLYKVKDGKIISEEFFV